MGHNPQIAPSQIEGKVVLNGVMIFLLLRTFANGSSSMTGIEAISNLAAAFLIIFHGNVDALISLYAMGVFISFTIAQISMVVHWRREKGKNWSIYAFLNGFGALVTGIVVIVIIIAKFMLGAWIVTILIPLIIVWFLSVHSHYKNMSIQLKLPPESYGGKIKDQPDRHNIVIVPISGVSRVVENTLKYARTISNDIRAFYVSVDKESDRKIKEKWDPGIPLIIRYSPYRTIVDPILEFIEEVKKEKGQDDFITVLIPEFETKRLWHRTLHNQTSWILRRYLVHEKDVVISVVPFQLEK